MIQPKISRRFLLLFTIFLIIPHQSCKKWFMEDYRLDIAGTYYGNRHSESWMIGYPTTKYDTMVYVVVELWNDSSVLIDGHEHRMDTGGFLVSEVHAPGWWVFNGRFDPRTDSLFTNSASGGLGGGSSSSFSGHKCPENKPIPN